MLTARAALVEGSGLGVVANTKSAQQLISYLWCSSILDASAIRVWGHEATCAATKKLQGSQLAW